MKLSGTTRIALESIPGAAGWFTKFLTPFNGFLEQITAGLRNNLTHDENMRCKTLELSFAHGVETLVAAPSFVVRGAVGIYANGDAVSAVKLSYKQSSQIGITVYFQSAAGTKTARVRLEA